MAYHAELWGSHKDLGNDDYWTGGVERTTAEEAKADLAPLKARLGREGDSGWGYACVEGPEGRVHEETNPKPSRRADDDGNEFAMQQGMGHGLDAYNEALGQDTDEEPPTPGMR